ncbi:MAG: FkbM family methyltransferase [Bacteroidota bacterium]
MKNQWIYDVGMHTGEDTGYYLDLGYNVLAVEASPDLVETGRKKFEQHIKSGRLEILNLGLSDKEDELTFYLNKNNSVWNSFDLSIASRSGSEVKEVRIKTTTLDKLIETHKQPHYIKIDIEGNDIHCLWALQHTKKHPKYISAEVNGPEVIEAVATLGYTKFKLIHQASMLPLDIGIDKYFRQYLRLKYFRTTMNPFVRIARKLFRNPIEKILMSYKKRLFKYDHSYGSSGPFGEKTPGEWKSYEEVMNIYNFHRDRHRGSEFDRGYNFWVDVHATK